jgi:hypothetical protein
MLATVPSTKLISPWRSRFPLRASEGRRCFVLVVAVVLAPSTGLWAEAISSPSGHYSCDHGRRSFGA